MLNEFIRVLYSDNGTLTDYSLASQTKSETIALPMVAAEDYLYVGQYLPFNNLFFEIETANDQTASFEVEYFVSGKTEWRSAVDLLDATKTSGVMLAQDGVLQWSPDRDEQQWKLSFEPDQDGPLELASTEIYNLYWARFKPSADLNTLTALKRLFYKFSTDEQLEAIEPEINNYLPAWETGKTNWTDQLILASQHVVMDLKSKGLIRDRGQVLRFDDVNLITAYRCLMHIYSVLGVSFESKRQMAEMEYNKLFKNQSFTFDQDDDAFVDRREIHRSKGQLVR